ncbi:Nucleotide exchange factor SIL1 [Paragonimus skrjabini miyazakii]|uniref:Nucleotide exchange factor SIL1 n=1 Tax=Paragonimus skrjabini miyazakii TaxID=59628 RepID=A0A8S9YH75_9TREM|nr:Nucleotide exchange factor SIL1 [Paragonimus skrjabini miyazakii]
MYRRRRELCDTFEILAFRSSVHSLRIMLVFLFLIVFQSLCLGDQQDNNSSSRDPDGVFLKTSKWQTAESEMTTPKHLPVFQDMNMGHSESLPNNDSDKEYPAAGIIPNQELETQQLINFNRSARDDPLQLAFTSDELVDEDKIQRTKKKFRSYEELKADFQSLNISVKTDLEILDDLFVQLELETMDENLTLALLEELSYLLHQIDNGKYFVEKNGFRLFRKFLLTSDVRIQKSVLSAMSAALQGNAHVKVAALQSEVVDILCNLLQMALASTDTADQSLRLLSSGLSALGALLRDFPSAQKYFFSPNRTDHPSLSGLDQLLLPMFRYPTPENRSASVVDLRFRIITLLADVMLERKNARDRALTAPDEKTEKLWRLYASTPFEESLRTTGWCTILYQTLMDYLTPGITEDSKVDPYVSHDHRERLLSALLHLHPTCRSFLTSDNHLKLYSILEKLEMEYSVRSGEKEDEFDFYFTDLYNLVVKIRDLLRPDPEHKRVMDEL